MNRSRVTLNLARRRLATVALTIAASVAAMALVGLDRYSWAEANPPLDVMGASGSTGHYWQTVVALLLVLGQCGVAMLAFRAAERALRLAWLEGAAFLLFNAALVARDGAARWAQWGFAATSPEFVLLIAGVLARVVVVAGLSVLRTDSKRAPLSL